jgi:hypothetical protein
MYSQRMVQNTHQRNIYRSAYGTVSQDTVQQRVVTHYGSTVGSGNLGNARIDYLQAKNPFSSRTTMESSQKDYY